jgi:hypothetical protein
VEDRVSDDVRVGPFRGAFLRREGVLRYFSPGMLIISTASLLSWGKLGILGIIIAGIVQDWGNEEPFFSFLMDRRMDIDWDEIDP